MSRLVKAIPTDEKELRVLFIEGKEFPNEEMIVN